MCVVPTARARCDCDKSTKCVCMGCSQTVLFIVYGCCLLVGLGGVLGTGTNAAGIVLLPVSGLGLPSCRMARAQKAPRDLRLTSVRFAASHPT